MVVRTECHGVVGSLGDGEDVGRDLVPPLEPVEADGALRVDGEALVRVHGDAEEAGVGLERETESRQSNVACLCQSLQPCKFVILGPFQSGRSLKDLLFFFCRAWGKTAELFPERTDISRKKERPANKQALWRRRRSTD